MFTQKDIALKLTEKILRNAKEVGADAIIVACPFCHGNLDTRQEDIALALGKKYDMPILYITQVMGWAFGLGSKELGLGKHFQC